MISSTTAYDLQALIQFELRIATPIAELRRYTSAYGLTIGAFRSSALAIEHHH